MKLYYAPGACSLAGRISHHEAGIAADFERVDLRTKITQGGDDFLAINAKGYVPALILDGGEMVTENLAVLSFLADREPQLAPPGPLARTRLVEMLAFLSTEIHKGFAPIFHNEATLAERARAAGILSARLDFLCGRIAEHYLFGAHFTVADAYLFVMLRWALAFKVQVPLALLGYFERVEARPAVRRALAEEGLNVDRPLPHADIAAVPAEA
jgi:glutathione S-transferase